MITQSFRFLDTEGKGRKNFPFSPQFFYNERSDEYMSITASFGTWSGNPEKVNKDVSFLGSSTTVQATRDINDLTCEFILDGQGYHGCNYMEVFWGSGNVDPETGESGVTKYYFIEKREGMPGNMTKITATCDVLTTYASAVYAAPAVIGRTSKSAYLNNYLKDEKTPMLSDTYFSSSVLGDINGVKANTEYFYVGVWSNKTAITPST